jgi:hypothetical protein
MEEENHRTEANNQTFHLVRRKRVKDGLDKVLQIVLLLEIDDLQKGVMRRPMKGRAEETKKNLFPKTRSARFLILVRAGLYRQHLQET